MLRGELMSRQQQQYFTYSQIASMLGCFFVGVGVGAALVHYGLVI